MLNTNTRLTFPFFYNSSTSHQPAVQPLLSWSVTPSLPPSLLYHFFDNSPRKSVTETTASMSRRNGNFPKVDLKLNLAPPQANPRVDFNDSQSRSSSVSPTTSSASSCLSSEENYISNSLEATSMMVAGCPCCLMYVMLSVNDPKCPKCQSTVLLEVFNLNGTITKQQKRN